MIWIFHYKLHITIIYETIIWSSAMEEMNIFGAFCMYSTYLDVNEGMMGALPTRDKRHSQIFYICLFMVCDCSYMPSNAYMCRVVGSLLENQLHIRWIIRLAQGDIRDALHGEKPEGCRVLRSRAIIETRVIRLRASRKDFYHIAKK